MRVISSPGLRDPVPISMTAARGRSSANSMYLLSG